MSIIRSGTKKRIEEILRDYPKMNRYIHNKDKEKAGREMFYAKQTDNALHQLDILVFNIEKWLKERHLAIDIQIPEYDTVIVGHYLIFHLDNSQDNSKCYVTKFDTKKAVSPVFETFDVYTVLRYLKAGYLY